MYTFLVRSVVPEEINFENLHCMRASKGAWPHSRRQWWNLKVSVLNISETMRPREKLYRPFPLYFLSKIHTIPTKYYKPINWALKFLQSSERNYIHLAFLREDTRQRLKILNIFEGSNKESSTQDFQGNENHCIEMSYCVPSSNSGTQLLILISILSSPCQLLMRQCRVARQETKKRFLHQWQHSSNTV